MSPGGLVVRGSASRRHARAGRPWQPSYPEGVSALAWWLIPIVATVLAIAWAAWRARPERPTEAHDGMESLRRFQSAMEKPLPVDRERP